MFESQWINNVSFISVKLPVSPDKVTLGDFKNVLNRPNYKFFFKSMDDDFGVVKVSYIPVFLIA